MKYWFMETLSQWKINEIFCFFSMPSLWNPLCIFYDSAYQFGLATLQVLSSHIGLVATKQDSIALEHLSPLSHISAEESSTRSLFGGAEVLPSLLYSSIIGWKMKQFREKNKH